MNIYYKAINMLKITRFEEISSEAASLSISVFDTHGRWIRTMSQRASCKINGYKDGAGMLAFSDQVGAA